MKEIVVYDKAKYHYEGDFPDDLNRDQAYVHIGMYFGWLCDNNLISTQMIEDFNDEIKQFNERKITGARVLKLVGGTLANDMLNHEGNAFTKDYFDSAAGQYLEDYTELLAKHLPTPYHVADSWANYDILKKRVDERYRLWKGSAESSHSSP